MGRSPSGEFEGRSAQGWGSSRHLGTGGQMDLWSHSPQAFLAPSHLLSMPVSTPGAYLAIYFW